MEPGISAALIGNLFRMNGKSKKANISAFRGDLEDRS
jgi:hypothetical protein